MVAATKGRIMSVSVDANAGTDSEGLTVAYYLGRGIITIPRGVELTEHGGLLKFQDHHGRNPFHFYVWYLLAKRGEDINSSEFLRTMKPLWVRVERVPPAQFSPFRQNDNDG